MAGVSVCPPVALDQGMELLCQLFEQWGQVPSGFLTLMQWLLGDDEGNDKTVPDKDSSLGEDDFLFEKGDLNLWAEPVQWVKLLHRNLSSLIPTFKQTQQRTSPDRVKLHSLSIQAQAKALSSQQALEALPPLPQFSCPIEHGWLTLQHQRATLALDVLERLR